MGTEFLRLKRKHTTWRVLRMVMAALATGMLLAGAMLVFFKLTTTDGQFVLCLAAGGAAAVVTAVTVWLAMRRSDLRSAEQIDREHKLKERVQTMIAFREEDSAMLQMQRQDTEDKLKAVKSYGVRAGSVVAHIGSLVLAVALLLTGVILPARAEKEPYVEPEPEFDATAWQIASLEELILHVENSAMETVAKEGTLEELTLLRDTLEGSVTVSAFKVMVLEAITNIYEYKDRSNSNDDMHDIVVAIDHKQAEDLAYAIGSLNNPTYMNDIGMVGTNLGLDYMLPQSGAFADALDEQLAKVPTKYLPENAYGEDDILYQALVAFAAGMHDVADLVEAAKGVVGEEAKKEANQAIADRLGDVMYDLQTNANIALQMQGETQNECAHVVKTLCSIFGISNSECPPDPDPTYTKNVDTNDEVTGPGGAGTGEMQYAGEGQVYDYKQNQYVSYTELVTEYYNSMLQAKQEGRLSEEMVDFIMKYFEQLYTG